MTRLSLKSCIPAAAKTRSRRTGLARAMAFAGAIMTGALASGAQAQSVEQFYKNRQIDMIIYTANNSAYDFYARLLTAHMGRFIPGNPTFVPKNMIGAGGLKASEYLYKIAAKDGATVGTVGRGLPFDQFLGRNEMGLDFVRFNWLGSMNRESTVALSWHTSKVKTFEDLQKIELLVPGTRSSIFCKSSNVFTFDVCQESATVLSRFMLPIQLSFRKSMPISLRPRN